MSQLVSFVVSIVLARILTPTDYGLVALVNVFIIIADVFVTSGFSSSLIQKKNANKVDFSSIFYCSLVFSILIYALVFFLAPLIADFYHNNSLVLILRVFALRLPISAFNSIQQAYVSRKLAFKKIFISTSCATIISGIIGVMLALRGFGVWALVFQYLINSFCETIVLFFQIPWHPQLLFSWRSSIELMNYGWKILATDLLGQFFNQLRSLVIGRFYAPSSLAYYNRGQQFPNILSNNIDVTITSVLFPAMSEYADNRLKLKSIVRRSIRTSTYILMPLMFGMAVVAKPLILIILTKKWLPAAPFMQCLCISGAFGSINTANMQAIKASGRSDILLKLEIVKKPVYLLFLLFSIKISVLAVAITMAMYSITAVFMNMYPNNRIIHYSYKEQLHDIFPSLFLSIFMAALVYLITFINISAISMLILQVLSGAFIYIIGSIILHMESFTYLIDYVRSIIKEKK